MSVSADLIGILSDLTDDLRSDILEQNPELRDREVIIAIADQVNRIAREDLSRAERLANVVAWIAGVIEDDFCRARAARCVGNIRVLRGNYQEALREFEHSLEIFHKLGADVEEAATLSSALQPLIYLGNYSEALTKAQRAKEIARRNGDELLLARLDVNFGNILHRQNRFSEAVKCYQIALANLRRLGQPRDCAIALLNLAVCYISLNDFCSAEEAYRNARMISEEENMPTITAQADYNIAYLYYYRSEYGKAIELYQKTRQYCQKVADHYHSALCDLDQSEMYLDLHLQEEATQLATQALAAFEQMKMPYEAAKSIVSLGIGAYQSRKPFRALELFAKAREQMRVEGNSAWVAVLDLYQALLMQQEGRYYEALRYCKNAQSVLATNSGSPKAVHADLVRASLHVDLGQEDEASKWFETAIGAAEKFQSPNLLTHAYMLFGRFLEARHSVRDAVASYRRSLEYLETMPVQSNTEGLKIPYSKNKSDIYEALLSLGATDTGTAAPEAMFDVIEKSKSREIAELISFRANALPTPSRTRSALVEQMKGLREELNWYYRKADNADVEGVKGTDIKAEELRRLIRIRENSLLKTLDELRNTEEEFHAIQAASTTPIDEIRRRLMDDELILEFCEARGVIYGCLLTHRNFQIVPLTRVALVREHLRRLHAQFTSLRLGLAASARSAESQLRRTLVTLEALHEQLIDPIRSHLEELRLIIVPDGPLRYVPFHALFDGARFLSESHVLSYAGSASLYYFGSMKKSGRQDHDVLVRLPASAEGRSGPISNSQLDLPTFLRASNVETLQARSEHSRFIHLECTFRPREDNSVLSTLQIGENETTILDIFNLNLSCSLIGLTGTGPGIRASGDGKELQGLARALEYAGAQTALLPLWNSFGMHTDLFFAFFYAQASQDHDKAIVFQRTLAEVRKHYPNPFYWASFILRGQTGRANVSEMKAEKSF